MPFAYYCKTGERPLLPDWGPYEKFKTFGNDGFEFSTGCPIIFVLFWFGWAYEFLT